MIKFREKTREEELWDEWFRLSLQLTTMRTHGSLYRLTVEQMEASIRKKRDRIREIASDPDFRMYEPYGA